MASKDKEETHVMHDHDRPAGAVDHGAEAGPDHANKALVDALHFSFVILKIIMFFVIVIYLASGTFQVPQGQVAMISRFGKILGTGPERELQPGFHWSWPWPIDERIRVPKGTVRTANCTFWFHLTDQEKLQGGGGPAGDSLVPGKDDYVLTGDANILHVNLDVQYTIADACNYVRTIPGADRWDPLTNPDANPELPLVSRLARSAIIQSAGSFKVEDIWGSQQTAFTSLVEKNLRQSLQAMDCGLDLRKVLVRKIEPPRQVVKDFIEVRNATEQKFTSIETARGDANELLKRTAGPGYEQIIQAIRREQSLPETDPRRAAARKEVEQLLEQAGGTVQDILADARIYRTRVVEDAKADAEYMKVLLPKYLDNPRVVLTRLVLGMFEATLPKVQKWYLAQGTNETRITIDRDPEEMKNLQPAADAAGEFGVSGGSPPAPPPGGPPPAPPSH